MPNPKSILEIDAGGDLTINVARSPKRSMPFSKQKLPKHLIPNIPLVNGSISTIDIPSNLSRLKFSNLQSSLPSKHFSREFRDV